MLARTNSAAGTPVSPATVTPRWPASRSVEQSGGAGCGRLGDAAVQGDLGEQPGAAGQDGVQRGRHGTGGVAGEGDARGVAAERWDLVAHPPQRGPLVVQAGVAGAGQVRVVGEAGSAQAVVDGDDDAFGVPREVRAVRAATVPEPLVKPPPWIHTRTGSPAPARGRGVHTFSTRQSSPAGGEPPRTRRARTPLPGCAADGPGRCAARTPWWTGAGPAAAKAPAPAGTVA